MGSPPLSYVPTGQAVVTELLSAYPAGTPFDGPGLLAEHPELTNHRSAMLQLAYEDFCRRDNLGIAESPNAFAARYPKISRSLLCQLGAHRLVVELNAAEDNNWPVAGQTWLGFDLLEELGRGAFSRVYLAREPALGDRLVVVKATSLGPNEARTLGMLRHPHIVRVHTVRWDDHLKKAAVCMAFVSRVTLFAVMDSIDSAGKPPGRAATILEMVREMNAATDAAPETETASPWPQRWQFSDAVLQIGSDIAEALLHAHRQGVLHGDVKPSNILLTDSGSAVLLDFNLAIFEEEAAPFVAGTLPYMAPEQIRPVIAPGTAREAVLDQRTDIFSLGVTLFELAYGWHPFGALLDDQCRQETAAQLLDRQKLGVTLPDCGADRVDRRLGEIILRCMAYDPRARPQSMAELLALLDRELKPVRQAQRWARSHRRLVMGAATLACAAGLALGGWQASREPYPMREFKSGQAAWQQGDSDTAIRHLSAALKADPKFLEARFLRGCAHCRAQEYLAARADLVPLVEELPDGRAAAALAHVVYQMKTDLLSAAAYYRKAVDQGCRTAVIYNNLGLCRAKTRSFDEAAEALKQACDLDPELGSARFLRVHVAAQIAARQDGVTDTEAVDEALRADPESPALKLQAALYFFFCARASDDPTSKRNATDRMFELLAQGLDRGLTRQHLAEFLRADSNLEDDPRWQALEAHPPLGIPFASPELAHDPLEELTRPQNLAVRGPAAPREPCALSAVTIP
jgi:serine/threonine protein kinase/Tfp pilus assembly protein PilF